MALDKKFLKYKLEKIKNDDIFRDQDSGTKKRIRKANSKKAKKEANAIHSYLTGIDTIFNTDSAFLALKTDNTIISVLSLDNIVVIQGNVFNPGPMTYSRGQKIGGYIRRAGGLRPDTLKRKIYIQRVNGRTKNLHVLNKWVISPKPGDTIIVPLEENAKDFNTNAFLADLTQTLTSLMTIIFIVDSMNDDN